jgi:hypothetical protein
MYMNNGQHPTTVLYVSFQAYIISSSTLRPINLFSTIVNL